MEIPMAIFNRDIFYGNFKKPFFRSGDESHSEITKFSDPNFTKIRLDKAIFYKHLTVVLKIVGEQ